MGKMRIHIISESEISVQGHGVHTAYVEMTKALREVKDVKVTTGDFLKWTECDVVHIHTVGLRALPRLFQPGVKHVVSAHIVPESLVGSIVGAKYWSGLATAYLRWFYNRADLVIAVSDETKNVLEVMKVKPPIKVVYNSIDISPYQNVKSVEVDELRKRYGIAKGAKVVMGSGQVQPRKRIDTFLAVAQAMPDVHFMWVGGIPFKQLAAEYKDMKRLMDDCPSNVTFTDMVPLESMPVYYTMADVFFLPSDQETFGLVIVEAAATGKPVVLRDIADYAETFASNVKLAKTDKEFTSVIRKLLTNKNEYDKAVKQSEKIAKTYDSRVATTVLLDAYKKLCNTKDS